VSFFKRRRRANYERTFEPDYAKRVLADLHAFCTQHMRANANPYLMAVAVGRFEVWNMIQQRLHLDEDQVLRLVHDELQERTKEAKRSA
jgi:siderophore synthetase component